MENILLLLKEEAIKELEKASNLEKIQELEVLYFGRKGKLTILLKSLKDLPPEEKPKFGKLSNEIKNEIFNAFSNKKIAFENEKLKKELETEFFDTTIPGPSSKFGHIHPLYQVQKEVEDIFSNMGFSIMDGPELESEYYNFIALNIPNDHPARDMHDTFFVKRKKQEKHGGFVMRTHTSPTQIRTMEKYGAPLRVIVPGRTFRYESLDATHEATFDQIEGLIIDKDISLAHLKGIMAEMLSKIFNKEVTVRLRPGYFPFVEPGLELDFSCLLCDGKGCKTCKNTGWIEFMGCGMVHKNVLAYGGIDSNEYQGWAFGFGLTRLVMMRYKIPDIRLLSSGDIRLTQQF